MPNKEQVETVYKITITSLFQNKTARKTGSNYNLNLFIS